MNGRYEIRTLETTPFEVIHEAMLEAFSDYQLDMSYMTRDVLRCRTAKNGVDLAGSPGAFLHDRLVGFTLVGMGAWEGELAAFDACTGIVKAHRGQGLAGILFEAALPGLAERGARRFLLEVLQENVSAIKAYERTGFRTRRPLACYHCETPDTRSCGPSFEIRSVGPEILETFAPELDWQPSWENRFEGIRAIPDEVRLHGVFEGGSCVALAAYCPPLRWILTLVVRRNHRRRGIGKALLARVLDDAGPGRAVRVNNVTPSDAATVALLRGSGFTVFATQYEMERPIAGHGPA